MTKIKVHSHFSTDRGGRFENPKHSRIYVEKAGKMVELFPSQKVVPNQALKPKDIIDRFTRGLPIETPSGTAKAVYPDQKTLSHNSPDMNALARLTKMEKADIARSAKIRYKPDQPKDAPAPHPENMPKPD